MKRVLLFCVCVMLFGVAGPGVGADDYEAGQIRELQEAHASMLQRLIKLEQENAALHQEIARLKSSNKEAATQETIKALQDKIVEVDKKRIADNQNTATKFAEQRQIIATEMESLRRLIIERGGRSVPPPRSNEGTPGPKPPPGNGTIPDAPPPGTPQKGYDYIIKKGDTLGGIVTALRASEMKITQQQVRDANPDVKDWNRIQVGQKLFIPHAPQ